MIESICHIGPALNVQGGISSVLVCYKKLFGLQDKHFIATYNGSFVKSLPLLVVVCLKLLIVPPKWVKCFQIHTSADGSFFRKYLVSLCLRIRRKKYIVHIHGSRMKKFCEGSNLFVRALIRNYLRNAQKVVVITADMESFLSEKSGLKDIYVVVPNPCENVVNVPVNLDRDGIVKIVFSGRMGKRKGTYDLVEAFSKAKFNVEVRMDLYGDGDTKQILKFVSDKGLRNVFVKSWILHKDYLEILPQYDILALPSYSETFGMSLVEAMGIGIPVISTDADAIPHVVKNGISGILNKPGDINALTTALETLVNDKKLRVKMGHDAWVHAKENFTGDIILEKLEQLYKDLV